MRIILASTSTYRRHLLAQAGFAFAAHAPDFDEETQKTLSLSPPNLCLHLAKEKAKSLRHRFRDAIIIGSDQLVHFESRILGKPGGRDEAISQLMRLANKTHELITSLSVQSPTQTINHVEVTKIKLRPLTLEEASAYVDFDKPFDCAGSYKIESGGIRLIDKMDCDDFTAIVGLPLIALNKALLKLGYMGGFIKRP